MGLAAKYDAFMASDTLIKLIPRLLGPGLNKAGKFPHPGHPQRQPGGQGSGPEVHHQVPDEEGLCLSVAVGNVGMGEEELVQNIHLAMNFLVSLLKKHWQNVKSLHIKSTMGPVQRLY